LEEVEEGKRRAYAHVAKSTVENYMSIYIEAKHIEVRK
jgi:hypothetical protein